MRVLWCSIHSSFTLWPQGYAFSHSLRITQVFLLRSIYLRRTVPFQVVDGTGFADGDDEEGDFADAEGDEEEGDEGDEEGL